MRLQFKEPFVKDSTGHLLCKCGSIKWDVDPENLIVRCLECDNGLELIDVHYKDKNKQ